MHSPDYSNRPPLSITDLAHALADAAKTAQGRGEFRPEMPRSKRYEELFSAVVADWFGFLEVTLDLSKVYDQEVELRSKAISRQANAELRALRLTDRGAARQPYNTAAWACKKTELQWLKYLDGVTEEWQKNVSEKARLAVKALDQEFLQYSGSDAIKILRRGYGSATNTYWGLIAVCEKLRAASSARLASTPARKISFSECARRLSLVLLSLHVEHLREVDLRLRGQNSTADYRPYHFILNDDKLVVRPSAMPQKLPDVGTSIGTTFPAAKAQTRDNRRVVNALLQMFDRTYLSMSSF